MAITDKYYTPSIEELYIGFECEVCDEWDWKDKKYNYRPLTLARRGLDYLTLNYNGITKYTGKEVKYWKLRVKYLDKEDIESLGFKNDGDRFWDGGNYEILFNSHSSKLRIREIFYESSGDTYDVRFDGIIKNKSELKRVLKQLDIYEDE
jgi:hypothetical protein